MAIVFDAKDSTGILLPMPLVGNIFAVIYYNRHAQWKYLFRLLPFMMFGAILANFIGKEMDKELFRKSMSIVIFISVVIMFWWDRRKFKEAPQYIAFTGLMGFTAGFTTMVGNLAGSFSNIFFLAMRLP